MIDIARDAAAYQVELFQHIGEFWGRATGMRPEDFSSIPGFGAAIHRQGHYLQHRAEDAFTFADQELRTFYVKNATTAYRLASRLGGSKLVLGGASNFGTSQFSSARTTLLYADTVFIPDPVYPWIEDDRKHEKFRLMPLLREAHAILHLRPLVDANLPHCPVFVFPSFEKSLERDDATTKNGIDRMVADLLAHYVDPAITSLEDAHAYAASHTDRFLEGVERHSLFVPPETSVGEPIAQGLKRYDDYVRTWRAPEYVRLYERSPIGSRVLTSIVERISPQYHLMENAEGLTAHPLLSVEQQGHYFKLVSELNAGRLANLGLLDQATRGQLAALSSERLEWLADIPIDTLAKLREDNEHEAFRKTLTQLRGLAGC